MRDAIDRYLPWFSLKNIPFLGNRTAKVLIDIYGNPESIFELASEELRQIEGLSSRAIYGLTHPEPYMEKARAELITLMDHSIGILTLNQKEYPSLLRQIPDPPLILTYTGDLLCRQKEAACIAIVGSRTPTAYGIEVTRHLSESLARTGFIIVSGMARGLDTAAHWGALEAKGGTVAVLGSGLGRIYPPENKPLFSKIQKNGTVLSEFPFDAPPLGAHFPARNRIIAGMSLGTLVVEAAKKSGSLITARLACEYNREVFAVPGSITSAKSLGTHDLLRQGAVLVQNVSDILDELKNLAHIEIPEAEKKNTDGQRKAIDLDKESAIIDKMIGPYPVHIDTIIENSGMQTARVNAVLLDLELSGRITRHPGNYFSRQKDH